MNAEQDYANLLGAIPQTESPNDIYAENIREEKIANLLAQINPDNLLIEIEYRIRGYKKNNFNGQWEKISKNSKPINDDLVSDFVGFLGGFMNQSTTMSNFSNEEINNIMFAIKDWIKYTIPSNKVRYELNGNYSEWNRIGLILMMNVFSCLKRAQNGMEARRIFSSMKIHESLTSNSPQQKSFSDALNFWK